jgi:hypothetical protein
MKSQFLFKIKEGYLQLDITGTYEIDIFLSLPAIIKARCEKEKIYKVLVNGLDLKHADLSTSDRYFLGEKFGEEFRNYINIAVVWPAKFIDKFAETVALNRGGKMYVTGDFPTAEEWLLNSQI